MGLNVHRNHTLYGGRVGWWWWWVMGGGGALPPCSHSSWASRTLRPLDLNCAPTQVTQLQHVHASSSDHSSFASSLGQSIGRTRSVSWRVPMPALGAGNTYSAADILSGINWVGTVVHLCRWRGKWIGCRVCTAARPTHVGAMWHSARPCAATHAPCIPPQATGQSPVTMRLAAVLPSESRFDLAVRQRDRGSNPLRFSAFLFKSCGLRTQSMKH